MCVEVAARGKQSLSKTEIINIDMQKWKKTDLRATCLQTLYEKCQINAFHDSYLIVTVVNVTESDPPISLCILEFYNLSRHDRLSFVVKLNSHPVSERVL